MLRAHLVLVVVVIAAGCGSSEGGGSGGAAGQSGSGGSGGSAGQSGSGGSGASGGQDGSAGAGASGGRSGQGGSAGRTGSGGAGGGAGGGSGGSGGRICGGFAGLTCESDEWCDFADHCGDGDQAGVCKPKPNACTDDCPGVCGCDGKQYCNACQAQTEGIDVSPDRTCTDAGTSGACTSDAQCARGLKCCYPCGIEGCENRCMTPDPSGQCPLFP